MLCIAILSAPGTEYPDISVRCVGGPVTNFEKPMGTTYSMIQMRGSEILAGEKPRMVDGLPARELHYRDHNMEICKVFLIRDTVGYSIIASNVGPLDKSQLCTFIDSMDWHYKHTPRTIREMFRGLFR